MENMCCQCFVVGCMDQEVYVCWLLWVLVGGDQYCVDWVVCWDWIGYWQYGFELEVVFFIGVQCVVCVVVVQVFDLYVVEVVIIGLLGVDDCVGDWLVVQFVYCVVDEQWFVWCVCGDVGVVFEDWCVFYMERFEDCCFGGFWWFVVVYCYCQY